jgi:hypothetical protein
MTEAALKRSSQSDSVLMSLKKYSVADSSTGAVGRTASTTEAKALACLHECWLASVGVAVLAT